MPEAYYEILSLGARYWFILLGVLIVVRSFLWLKKDRREKHHRLRQLPDAGTIGEMVVLTGNEELPEGSTIPVPWEGLMGYVRGCDMIVPVEGVAPRHCDVFFKNGVGLLVFPWRGCSVEIDGETVTNRKTAKEHPMHHGSCLKIGEATLRLRVFMGLETDRPAMMQADDEPEMPQNNVPQNSQTVYHQVPAAWEQTYQTPDQGYPYGNPQANNPYPMQNPYGQNVSDPPYGNQLNPYAYGAQDGTWNAPYENQPSEQPVNSYTEDALSQDAGEEPSVLKRHLLRRRDRHA